MSKRKRKKTIKLFLVIIIILLIGIASYLTFGKDLLKKNEGTGIIDIIKPEVKKLKIVDVDSKTRPYAVMINNISTARPLQSGLQDAYIIYEIIVEGGITRYMALFKDQTTERIGSIRSARHYFIDYALESDAIYVHHGQSPEAKSGFTALKVDRIEVNETTTGWRDKTLNVSSEHTLFSSIAKLNNGVSKLRTETNKSLLLNYSIDEIDMANIANSQKADSVSIKFSTNTTSSFEYDSEAKVYKRFVNDKAHTDYVTKEQYTFKNIITYQVKNTTLNDGENKGRQTIDNIGSGTGYYISSGYAIPIKWEKKARNEQTKYYYEDGTELKVNDGNTFIEIQPVNMAFSIKGDEIDGSN